MIVLGTKSGEHEACFAVVKDGEPLFVYEVERFNRVKHGVSSDLTVLLQGLADYGIAPGDIDVIASCGDPDLMPERLRQTREFLSGSALEKAAKNVQWRHPAFRQLMVAAGFPNERIVNVRHHMCHVASAFYASPFDDAALLSIDGSGEADTAMLAHGSRRDGIEVMRTVGLPHSLGRFYEAATQWLGWGFGEEGKTMALAGYGDPHQNLEALSDMFQIDADGFFEFNARLTDGAFSYATDEIVSHVFEKLFGPSRNRDDEIEQRHKDVAAATQHLCEQAMVRLAGTLKKQTGSNVLLISGGIASNSVANGAIHSSGIFERVVVYPQMTDAGTALGAALYAYHQHEQVEFRSKISSRRHWEMKNPFLGRKIDLARVQEAAAAFGVEGVKCGDPVAFAADRLAEGRIVGWVQDRAEIGPRALGNRSILGNPLTQGIKTRINAEVKHRENWRPFAPSVLEEDMGDFFETTDSLPYMTVVSSLRTEWREKLSSICHVDGTARVGSVSEEFNPLYYRLIQEVKSRTGIGMVLNTSFNDRGEPIIQTCEQALRLFVSSGMDALVIGDWVFENKQNSLVRDFDPFTDNCRILRDEPTLLVALREANHTRRVIDVLLREGNTGELTLCSVGEESQVASPTGKVLALDSLDALRDIAADWTQVAVLAPWSADRFVFDPTVYYSEEAEACRRLIEAGTHELFWVDPLGQVVLALDVLYVHHPTQPLGTVLSRGLDWRETGLEGIR
jgi:carbamoyltransferase